MRVAVFGGTGFVGGYLIDALLDAGHEPSVLVRLGSDAKLRSANKCRITHGDVGSEDAIAEALRGCAAVIFNIGILREFPRLGITFEELHFEAVARVANAAKKIGITRFLLMSANGVQRSGTPYQDTKYRAEEHVRSSGLAATVMRPSVIFGAPRGTSEIATQLHSQMIAPPLPAVGFFKGWNPCEENILMSPVHVADVARAFVISLQDDSTVGQTYTLGGPEILSWQEMLRRIGDSVGRNKWIMPMPISIMKVAATLLDWLPFFPATRDQLSMLAEGNTADPDALQQLIGRDPAYFSVSELVYLKN